MLNEEAVLITPFLSTKKANFFGFLSSLNAKNSQKMPKK